MPSLLSHHLFGRTLLARQKNNAAFMTRDARDAFLLGNQGPDPLFYAVRTPAVLNTTYLAQCMHSKRINEYLEMWRVMLEGIAIKDQVYEVMRAYVFGFLCHYALDRTAHPLVYAYEQAICNAGVKGLEPRDHTFVHSQIEADLDIFLLHRLTGRTLDEYDIAKQMLYGSDATLLDVDLLYRTAAKLYHITVPRNVFTRSIKDMRTAQRMLYSPGGTRRSLVGKAERLVRRHSFLQAQSHRTDAYLDNWYANENKEPWRHPKTGEESTCSFVELFEQALETAEADIKLYNSGAPVHEITQGLDFSGNRQETSDS